MLEKINSPQDIRTLNVEQLGLLATEIRKRIIGVVSKTGGHLASSLGAVELTLALHYCLNTPKDKLVFDVGHQAYAHKILTGRNSSFDSLRQYQGLSGFPSKDESVYDPFTTGHSSNAVSLALGLACGRDLDSPKDSFKTVAVIGDGSLSGGLCFEGLNNAGHLKKDILVVLNTNEMSIAPNAGAISVYLNKIISLPVYNRFKESLEKFANSRLPKGSRILKLANKFEECLKGLFVPGMLFEELGFRYFGPLDGHDLPLLVKTLKNLSLLKGPLLLHVVTKKGKGYPPAEKDPVRFHGLGPFDEPSGAAIATPSGQTYTKAFSGKIVGLAKDNEKIVAITAAMPEGTGLDKFRETFPGRFFDVGIAEQHAVSFAAGLAKAGFKPVVAVYSTFMQRAYDQIVEDVALQELPVVFCLDRAGVVGEDGVTHQGIFDIAYLNSVPGLTIMAPRDCLELEKMLEFAFTLDKPVAIRYPKGPGLPLGKELQKLELGEPEILKDGKDFAVFALGSMVKPAYEALEILEKQGLKGTLVNARFVKPLDSSLLAGICRGKKHIFSIEEGVLNAGFGSAISEITGSAVIKFGLPCEFIAHGPREVLLEKYGLTAGNIAEKIRSVYG